MPPVVTVAVVSFLSNLPLGYLRGGVRPGLKRHPKRSPEWWRAFAWTMLYIHLSIPIVAVLRIQSGVSPWWIPLFVALALLAQALGERFRLSRKKA